MTNGPWHPDGKGIQLGGDVGGDIQAGDAYEVRFARDDMPGSLINVRVYAVTSPGGWAIQTQTEYLVCTDLADPGGTELWSDYDYDDGVFTYETLADADQAARTSAEAELRDGASAQGWNGEPDYERRQS